MLGFPGDFAGQRDQSLGGLENLAFVGCVGKKVGKKKHVETSKVVLHKIVLYIICA